jgi:type II secretory pathway pseudopilin PulG
MRRDVHAEDGVVAVVVAISLMAMMAVAALAVDAGRGAVERSAAQNAADHAAMAAARAACTTPPTPGGPVNAGRQSSARNGFPHDPSGSTSVQVSATSVGGVEGWSATVTSEIQAPFGSVLGQDRVTARARAVARCDLGNGYAIYTYGHPSCDKDIEWSGSDTLIRGDIHTNGTMHISGSNSSIHGIGTYGNSYEEGGSNIVWDPGTDNPRSTSHRDWPLPHDIASFRPGGPVHAAVGSSYRSFTRDIDEDDLVGDGVYFTTREIDLDLDGLSGRYTFVAERQIVVSGDGYDLEAYHDDLLFFTPYDDDCDDEVIDVSANAGRFRGDFFAPGAAVAFQGSGKSASNRLVVEGSLVGQTVQLSGQHLEITFPEGRGEPRISLLR